MKKFTKIIVSLFVILICFGLVFYFASPSVSDPAWGVNYSKEYAKYLGLDWRQMWFDLNEDLGVRRFRVMAYWEEIEKTPGQFEFEELDFILQDAESRGAEVILTLGHKQPRWPECHHPDWYEDLTEDEQDAAVLKFIESTVKHFKNYEAIKAWQVENEPFFPYGPECGTVSWSLFNREVDLVKSLDNRPVIVTDSGEKGAWFPVAWAGGDIFGSTIYRTVYHSESEEYQTYPIPPMFYRIRAGMLRIFTGTNQVYGVEAQAEPWFRADIYSIPLDEQLELMNEEIFLENINYFEKIGFVENYLWGAEWWYWLKEQGHPEMWITAKNLMSK